MTFQRLNDTTWLSESGKTLIVWCESRFRKLEGNSIFEMNEDGWIEMKG